MPYYGVKVTGPAVTVIPPDSSVIVGVDPIVNVYLSVVVTVILKPDADWYTEGAKPPREPSTFSTTVSPVSAMVCLCNSYSSRSTSYWKRIRSQ